MTEHDIFAAAIRLSGDPRAVFLSAACGQDATLRDQVDALLRAHDASGSQQPTSADGQQEDRHLDVTLVPATPVAASQAVPGMIIAGRYKLLEAIGEGGMGTVWAAEQSQPVKRKVALKLIKAGMDSRSVIARFEAERQALALMDHPNIAKVLDGGMTERGRPYFVMEYVRGVPITEYCDSRRLSVPDRLQLFAQVCLAVQHAHQKGIIHRDLKPSNILVAPYDDKPVPKVIDFGLAKAVHQSLTDNTLHTAHDMVLGTPLYMSPEQAQLNNIDIDTRSDVYSLGVLLYELLTGSTPLEKQRFRQAAWDEMRRVIREEDPPLPSLRLSSAETLPSVAAGRNTEPARLTRLVRGELDWIVMKALEKDRTRRYETANGFAADVLRYLAGEPVTAAPPSTVYRFRKFVRRNRGKAIAVGCVAMALVLGLAGTVWQARVASVQRDKARTEADRAIAAEAEVRQRADELKTVADFQGQMLAQIDPTTAGVWLSEDVRARFDATLATSAVPEADRIAQVESFVGQWSRVNPTDTALELIDRTILKPAVEAIDREFADQPVISASLRHVLAERYHDLGLDNAALELEQKALAQRRQVLGDDHTDTLMSISNVGVYLSSLGQSEEAERCSREALEASRRVRGNDDPETLSCISNLGSLLMSSGKLAEAENYLREALDNRKRILGDDDPDTLASINEWGTLLKEQGKLEEAETYYRQALTERRRVLGEEHAQTLMSTNDLAVLLRNQGKLDESITFFREVTDKKRRILGEMHPSTLSSIQSLGATLDAAGHPAEAEAFMREALDKQRRLLGPDHSSTLATLGNLSVYLIGQNKLAEAEPLCRETLERRLRVLGENHAATLIANNVMGLVLIRQGRLAEGEPYWRSAQEIARRTLGPTHPETLVFIHNLAGLALDQKKPAEAEQLFREVIDVGSPTVGVEHPTVLSATRRLGVIMIRQNRYAEAVELLSAAEPSARKAYTSANTRFLGELLYNLGTARARLEQFAAAETNLLEALPIIAKTRGEKHTDTSDCSQVLADLYAAWDKADPENIARFMTLRRELFTTARSQLPENSPELAGQIAAFSLTLLTLKAWDEAEPLIREALTIRESQEPDDWRTFYTRSMLGTALMGQKKYAEAEPLLLAGCEGMKQREATIPEPAMIRLSEAFERLVGLYTDWHTAEPDKGYDSKAGEWQTKLEEHKAAAAAATPASADQQGPGK